MTKLTPAQRQARWRARNKERIRLSAAEWHRKHGDRHIAEVRGWRERNEARFRLQQAKLRISLRAGMPYRDVPDDLAEAKALQLEIGRWIRQIEAVAP